MGTLLTIYSTVEQDTLGSTSPQSPVALTLQVLPSTPYRHLRPATLERPVPPFLQARAQHRHGQQQEHADVGLHVRSRE